MPTVRENARKEDSFKHVLSDLKEELHNLMTLAATEKQIRQYAVSTLPLSPGGKAAYWRILTDRWRKAYYGNDKEMVIRSIKQIRDYQKGGNELVRK